MSDRLACERAREATDWLARYDPEDGHGLVGEQAKDPGSMFTQPVVLAAFAAGLDRAEDDFTIERATGQRQLDDATALMREAAELFRAYQRHHLDQCVDKARRDPRDEERRAKAGRNGLMAVRLEAWLDGKGLYPITADGSYVAHAAFRQPEPVASAPAFALQTVDPLFDPALPVTVNGFAYQPATEAAR